MDDALEIPEEWGTLREELSTDGTASIPGLCTLKRRERFISVQRWPDGAALDPDAPPREHQGRPAAEPHVTALLQDVGDHGAVHVPDLGIVGVHLHPGYEGRNPKTGQVILVPEKRVFTLLVDESLEAAVLEP